MAQCDRWGLWTDCDGTDACRAPPLGYRFSSPVKSPTPRNFLSHHQMNSPRLHPILSYASILRWDGHTINVAASTTITMTCRLCILRCAPESSASCIAAGATMGRLWRNLMQNVRNMREIIQENLPVTHLQPDGMELKRSSNRHRATRDMGSLLSVNHHNNLLYCYNNLQCVTINVEHYAN